MDRFTRKTDRSWIVRNIFESHSVVYAQLLTAPRERYFVVGRNFFIYYANNTSDIMFQNKAISHPIMVNPLVMTKSAIKSELYK